MLCAFGCDTPVDEHAYFIWHTILPLDTNRTSSHWIDCKLWKDKKLNNFWVDCRLSFLFARADPCALSPVTLLQCTCFLLVSVFICPVRFAICHVPPLLELILFLLFAHLFIFVLFPHPFYSLNVDVCFFVFRCVPVCSLASRANRITVKSVAWCLVGAISCLAHTLQLHRGRHQ